MLSGLKMPDFHGEKHLDSVVEAWKEIGRSVDKVNAKYNGVAETAKRISDATKERYEHERRMAEMNRNPAERDAALNDIDKREREENELNRAKEIQALKEEGNGKDAASKIIGHASDKGREAELKKDLEEKAKLGQEWLDNHKGGTSYTMSEGANALFTGFNMSDVSMADLEKEVFAKISKGRYRLSLKTGTL